MRERPTPTRAALANDQAAERLLGLMARYNAADCPLAEWIAPMDCGEGPALHEATVEQFVNESLMAYYDR